MFDVVEYFVTKQDTYGLGHVRLSWTSTFVNLTVDLFSLLENWNQKRSCKGESLQFHVSIYTVFGLVSTAAAWSYIHKFNSQVNSTIF